MCKSMTNRNVFKSREDLSNLLEGMRLGKISPDGRDDPDGLDGLDGLDRIIADLIAQQDEDGFLGFVDPRKVSSEIRVDLYYVPTYLCAAILMKCWLDYPVTASRVSGFTEAFGKALSASAKRSFKGHGFDDIYGVLYALEIFHKGGAARFISRDASICPEFNETVTKWLASFKKALETGNTKAGWDQDYSKKYRKILSLYDSLSDGDGGDDDNGGDGDSTVIFIYGSLMKGRANHQAYLGNSQSRYLGEGVLSGYALYDLGAFPGIRPSAEDRVKGELYEVSRSVLADINRLESEGTLYLLKKAKVAYADNSAVIPAYTYVYNNTPRESDKIPFEYQPWGKYGDYVWYASYGSNMLYERFMCYIRGGVCRFNGNDYRECKDKNPPIASMPVEIPYDMYFGNSSKSWGGSGVSFLDTSKPGKSLGRMYLITNEQMEHVHCQESKEKSANWYDKVINLGTKYDIPIKTITNHGLRPEHPPNEKYTSVILDGLRETYPEKNVTDLRKYIDTCNTD